MNLFKSILGRFTVRGRALAKVAKGRVCATNRDPDSAIKYYTEVVDSSESPGEVIAMALFNRALVYSTTGRQCEATEDLKAILCMPEAIAEIKESASDKLVRMRRKQEREEAATRNA
jgi:hypothetical protein